MFVTIGLPFYNNESTIELAIRSVLMQTHAEFEFILINDGSTDNSLKIAKKFTDSRIKLISDENRGLIYRLNQITSIARGEYLARMDGDDIMLPQRIEKQLAFLTKNKDIDVIDTGTYLIDQEGKPVGKRGLTNLNCDAKNILKHALLLHPSVMGKTKWFLDNPYDSEYPRAEDYELWCRTFRHTKFGRVKEPLHLYREGKINVKNYLKSSATIRKIIKRYGPGTLTFFELYITLLTLHSKEIAYKIFSLVNKHDYLVRTRNKPLTYDEQQKVKQLIDAILAYK
jgi:glycosyltransferase involved in cell wall biosynthesis